MEKQKIEGIVKAMNDETRNSMHFIIHRTDIIETDISFNLHIKMPPVTANSSPNDSVHHIQKATKSNSRS
jgi:ribosomal protein L11